MRRISRCAQDCLLCSDHHGQDRAKNQICAPAEV